MAISPGRGIHVAEQHPANGGVLAYLRALGKDPSPPLSARPGDVRDPYYELGTHPDVVELVWDKLGGTLPGDSRCVVLGTVALVHPHAGVLLALGLGTNYALRLAPADGVEARASAFETVHMYRTSGDVLDLATWGDDWFFGGYDRREFEWLARVYEQVAGDPHPSRP